MIIIMENNNYKIISDISANKSIFLQYCEKQLRENKGFAK